MYVYYALRFLDIHRLVAAADTRVRVLCSPSNNPRYTEKPCDNGQESSRVDEELRLLHNHRRARCLDVQSLMHIVGYVLWD